MSIYKVVKIVKEDTAKNGRPWKLVEFQPINRFRTLEDGSILDSGEENRFRLVWGSLVKDGKTTQRADFNFDSVKEGMAYDMQYVTMRTSGHKNDAGHVVQKMSAFIYSGKENAIDAINAKLQGVKDYCVSDADGVEIKTRPSWYVATLNVDKSEPVGVKA